MKEKTRNALEAAAESTLLAFGEKNQILKCIEEMSELSVKLAKRLNPTTHVTDLDIIDEIADATIMLNQVRLIFDPNLVDEQILYKLDRILTVIRDKNKKETRIHRDVPISEEKTDLQIEEIMKNV